MRWQKRQGVSRKRGPTPMQQAPLELGILWAVERLGSAGYGLESWKIFWRIVPVERLAGATLYEGDTDSTLRGGERLYCIGLGHPNPDVLEGVRGMLDESIEYGLVSATSVGSMAHPEPNFLQTEALARQPLVESGWVDSEGRVSGEGWAIPALEAVSREPTDADGLIAALQDPDQGLRNHAALALGDLGNAQAVAPLIEAFEEQTATLRRRVIWSLGRLKDSRAVGPIIRALDDPDWEVRVGAVGALGELGDRRAVDALIESLTDESLYVRGSAAQSLGVLGDTRAIGPLTAALEDEEQYVRTSAEIGLGWIGSTERSSGSSPTR